MKGGGRRMSSFHPAGWPETPVLRKDTKPHSNEAQPLPTHRGLFPHGPTDRKTVNEFRWLNEGRQRQLGSSEGVEQLSSVTPGQSHM